MIIDCVSDLHGHYPKLEGGDLLIVAGDLTARDRVEECWDCFDWMVGQGYQKIIYIAGNHDNVLQNTPPLSMHPDEGMLTYLCDSGTEFEYGPSIPCNFCQLRKECKTRNDCYRWGKRKLKVWGSPWTRRFEGMNPKCMAFTVDTEEELAEKWALIPDDTDILITHSPPYGILDTIGQQIVKHGMIDIRVGSKSLRNIVYGLKQLKLHCFGHIHESYNKMTSDIKLSKKEPMRHPIFVNASHVNERYQPVNKPIRIEL